jgi:hypothetical protein
MLPDKLVSFDVANDLTIKQLKEQYIEALGEKAEGMSAGGLRFLCLGKELKDDLFVYSYDIMDDITIQCMKRQSID